jgi:hypothetical protein
MPSAAETISRISNSLPRSQDIVDGIAGPCTMRENKTRRQLRIGAAALLLAFVGFVSVASGDTAAAGGVVIFSLLLIWLILWWVQSRLAGHAVELVRNGVAYPVRVERISGGAHGSSYRFTWKDGDGREGSCVFPPRKAPAPQYGDEAVALLVPGQKRVGILVNDDLCVV